MDDPRFQKFLKDPRSRNIPKNVKKIKVDKRFQNMFNKKTFKESGSLDERGRKLELTSSENLKKLYNYESESSEDDNETTGGTSISKSEKKNENVSKGKDKEPKLLPEHKNSTKNKLTTGKSKQGKINQTDVDVLTKTQTVKKVAKVKKEVTVEKSVVSDEESDAADEENTLHGDDESDEESSDESDELQADESDELQADESDEEESDESESDESQDSDDGISDKKGEFDHHWEEMQNEAPDTKEITRRLAVCNMDWDRIRAEDLYTVFNSFKPPDSVIHSVKIYPSEYGAKRMAEEKLKGPSELVEETLDTDEEEDLDDKKGSKYHIEKLRQYQMNRLKYFYAIVDCDTPETADTLYEQLNGMEYESSSVRFDLRFIPDDVTFDQEPVSVSEKAPDPTEYKPRLFVTTALQQVKVNLTWDETDTKRRETLQKAFTEPESIEKDIKDYLASSSGDSEGEQSEEEAEAGSKISTEERIAKYKALLQSLEEKDKKEDDKYEMEITWNPDLKDKTEEIVKQKMEEPDNPFDEIVKKQKERRLKKKEQKSAAKNEDDLVSGSESDSSAESDSSKLAEENSTNKLNELYLLSDSRKLAEQPDQKTRKRKKDKKVKNVKAKDFKVDVSDPRFSAIYTSHEFNIDPSDSHFKQTEGTLAFVQEKQNRLKNKQPPVNNASKKSKKMKYGK